MDGKSMVRQYGIHARIRARLGAETVDSPELAGAGILSRPTSRYFVNWLDANLAEGEKGR